MKVVRAQKPSVAQSKFAHEHLSTHMRPVIPNFGHFDNFVGAEANKYCYPAYLEQLEKCL